MQLGIAGMMPPLNEVNEKTVSRIREAGFTGVACKLPSEVSMTQVEDLKALLEDGGIKPVQANPTNEDLVNPDRDHRNQGIKTMQYMCHVTRRLGADNLYVRPGSLNPQGPWYPHPRNRDPRTRELLINSLKEISKTAETEGVCLSMEGHVLSPLYNAEQVRDVIEAVGSKSLRFNMDPVNFVDNLTDAYNTTSLLDNLFDILGPYTTCAHAKDFFIDNKLVLHLEETIIGRGLMDQVTFLKKFNQYCPKGYMLIEHLKDNQVPEAKAAFDLAAKQAGLVWEQARSN